MDKKVKKVLSGNQIKVIAIIAMTIDHLTWAIWPGFQTMWYVYALHIIGRLTAPIMWFFIAEGCHYTKNPGKYLGRLFVFAIISHFAYNFASGISFIPLQGGVFNQTSVMWSLALGAALIFICQNEKIPQWGKILAIIIVCVLSFPSDWSCIAAMCPFFMYSHRGNLKKQMLDIPIWSLVYGLVYFFFISKPYGVLQLFTCLSIPILMSYNGERGKWKGMKWFFYLYYPAHLIVVGIIRIALHGNTGLVF